MNADELRVLAARVAAEQSLPDHLTAPVLAALHTVKAAPPRSESERYGLECAAHVISDAWPLDSILGQDVLAYVQARRR